VITIDGVRIDKDGREADVSDCVVQIPLRVCLIATLTASNAFHLCVHPDCERPVASSIQPFLKGAVLLAKYQKIINET